MDEEKVAVSLSKNLYDLIANRFKENTGEFKGVENYVEFILREFLKEKNVEERYTKEEEELIKKRLRRLGYL